MYCNQCSLEISETARFCPSCGAKVHASKKAENVNITISDTHKELLVRYLLNDLNPEERSEASLLLKTNSKARDFLKYEAQNWKAPAEAVGTSKSQLLKDQKKITANKKRVLNAVLKKTASPKPNIVLSNNDDKQAVTAPSNSVEIKCICNHCDQHIQFPREMINSVVSCPNCKMDTTLFEPSNEPHNKDLANPSIPDGVYADNKSTNSPAIKRFNAKQIILLSLIILLAIASQLISGSKLSNFISGEHKKYISNVRTFYAISLLKSQFDLNHIQRKIDYYKKYNDGDPYFRLFVGTPSNYDDESFIKVYNHIQDSDNKLYIEIQSLTKKLLSEDEKINEIAKNFGFSRFPVTNNTIDLVLMLKEKRTEISDQINDEIKRIK